MSHVRNRELERRRNIEFEREVTRHVARGMTDPVALINHAETRAWTLSAEYVSDPMMIAVGRDRVSDVREEIADARNHLVWWLEENLDDPSVAEKQSVLQLLVVAYDRLATRD